VRGTIKFFNDQKGFGFIRQSKGKDIFVHHSAITMDGNRMLQKDDEVEFEVVEGQRGQQASNVRKV
jgi:CspA family cold shock protein